MLRSVLSGVILIVVVLLMSGDLSAEVPLVVSHQGRLLDASDAPVSGVFTIVYSIWDAETGGTQLWMEDHTGVVVTDGLFSVQLGTTVPITSDILHGSGGGGGGSGGTRYLQLQLPGQPPISPRTQLSSSPFSITSHSVGGDIETFPGGFKTRCQGCNDPWRGDISAASVPGADSIQVVRLNGLPPGTPVTGRAGLAVTDDVSSIWLGDIDADGALDMHCGPDSTVFDMQMKGSGFVDGRYVLRAGAGLASRRMSATNSAGMFMEISEDCDDVAEMRMHSELQLIGAMTRTRKSLHPDSITVTNEVWEAATLRQKFEIKERPSGQTCGRRSMNPMGDTTVVEEVCDTAGASLRMKIDGLMGPRMSTNLSISKQSSSHLLAADLDGDGVQDNVCSSSTNDIAASMGVSSRFGSGPRQTVSMDGSFSSANTRCASDSDGDGLDDASVTQSADDIESRLAIKTKGTSAGSRVNKIDAFTIKQGIAGTQTSTDDDGDGSDDQVITQTTSDTESRLAIKTKGTSAGSRVNKIDAFTIKQGIAGTQTSTDDDGDGSDDQVITQTTSDTESRLAIKTKGTSAGGRVSKVDAFTLKLGIAGIDGSTDDDGDGVPERRFQTLSNASKARHGCAADIDGDGQLDRISSLETDSLTAAMRVGADDDDDGVVDWSASVTADTADAQVLTTGSDIEVAMKVKNKGVVKGNVTINNASARMVDFDSDGDGFLENSLGVGVDATHKIDVVGGAYCDGTNWVNASDRNAKENFEKVNGEDILERIAELEITKWNYKGDVDAQHIGPTAQDFKKAFGVGADDKSISTIDPSGIALAAIKELYTQLQAKDKEMGELREELAKLKKEMAKKK